MEIKKEMNIDIDGNWTNMGNFIPGKSTVTFNGATNQTVNVSNTERFYNLSVDKSHGDLILLTDIIVKNYLGLSNGKVNATENIVTLAGDGSLERGAGYIMGSLRKSFTSQGVKTFEVGTLNGYTPVDVKVSSDTGQMTITSLAESHPRVEGTSVLQRYWTVQSKDIKKADMTFHYLPQDISGLENCFVAGNYKERWSFPQSDIDPILHIMSVSGANPSGDWTSGQRDALSSAQVALNYTLNANKVNLAWQVRSGSEGSSYFLERADYWLKNWTTIANMDDLSKHSMGSGYLFTDNPPSGRYLYRLRQVDSDNNSLFSNEVEVAIEQPGSFTLEQNYPNPFNAQTKISYTIPVDSRVNIIIFNVTGQIITRLVDEYQSAGQYTLYFDASNLASGTYLYKMVAGSFVQTKKMVVLR
ncbi:MAG: T9SS type A sorting domain-containing protein [Bacteroidota bacterium]|nr:T9SS type A sorting domain-containing protein [Bacteroidota bacterium]